MTSLDVELIGVQVPQVLHLPPGVVSLEGATEAIELAESVGLFLDESQQFTLRCALGERADGTWAAFEVADIEPRQNGKGGTIEARELAGLFLFGEELQIHTAHEFRTANEAFLRMAGLIEGSDDLRRKVQRVRYANGEQGIELRNGQRLKYSARTGGAGRGLAGAAPVYYDEAYALEAEHVAASLPTLSTHPNPQVWYASSAGLASSSMLHRLRKRALRGDAGRLAYLEHTAEQVSLDVNGRVVSIPPDPEDRQAWALANPALGGRIPVGFVEAELAAMGPEKFLRERLGVWDPEPSDTVAKEAKIPADRWELSALSREMAAALTINPGEVTVAFDATWGGRFASIAIAAGSLEHPYVELVEHRAGLGWLPSRLVELVQKWKPIAVGCDGGGPAGALVGPVLSALSVAGFDLDTLHQFGMQEYKQACGGFFADVIEGRLRRPAGQGPLDVAADNAAERPLGDAWAWDRRTASVPISPLVAVTLARALLPVSVDVSSEPMFALSK